MGWFNYYGLAIVAIILVPNIVFAIKRKDGFASNYNNKAAQVFEQIGRYGCMAFTVFNVPYTYSNFWFDNALTVYLSVNSGLCFAYLLFWGICWNNNGKLRALSLSIIPSAIFLFGSIVLASLPLIAFAVIFAVNHILISYKNSITN